ncbi:hypothetical protein [Brevundimonas sp.]|uniref:hypothetical protein n=1 Tax=Brevundimonas sp. TaxID=1871086 RepID=UPI002D383C23|nr:hypothetical protein [Brevundimonas sp.]HYC98614.1 hypothetical protein [Brevundimonas sp.]
MSSLNRLTLAASIGAFALIAAACTPADNDADTADGDTDTTIVETREVPANPVVVEREVPVPTPPVVVEDRRDGDSTTVRAGRDGLEVETTNR